MSLLFIAFFLLCSHDMFLKLDTYILQPGKPAIIKLLNGTYDKSDNIISRDRMMDVSLLGNSKRINVDTSQWFEDENVTLLNFTSGASGTWVAGVSTKPRNIEMTAADFNSYLEHDGVLDMLDWRKTNNALELDAVEEYSKHVKTIFQVGTVVTNDYQTPLGYPIEFIPLENPYDLHPGHGLQVKVLWQGEPLPGQLVYAGLDAHGHTHDQDENHDHEHGFSLRSNEEGIVSINLTEEGIYHLRTIHMTTSEKEGLTHESNWATLTFEVGEGHSHSHEEAVHSHEEGQGLMIYVYGLGSLALVMGLFFWFNRKNK